MKGLTVTHAPSNRIRTCPKVLEDNEPNLYNYSSASECQASSRALLPLKFRWLLVSGACHVGYTSLRAEVTDGSQHRTGIANRRFVFWRCLHIDMQHWSVVRRCTRLGEEERLSEGVAKYGRLWSAGNYISSEARSYAHRLYIYIYMYRV